MLGVRPGCGDGDKSELKKWTSENAACIRQYYEGELDFGPYSTDANIPLSRNVLANTIGTVKGAGAHTRAEWMDRYLDQTQNARPLWFFHGGRA